MSKMLSYCLIFALSLSLSGCVSLAPRIEKIPPPSTVSEGNSFAGETVYLTDFEVGNGAKADTENKDGLKRQFMDYLLKSAKFGAVKDATAEDAAYPPDALRLSVNLQPILQGGHLGAGTYFLILMYGAGFIYGPRTGSVFVQGTAELSRGHSLLSSRNYTSEIPFSYGFLGPFRSGPIRQDFAKAYEDVFRHIAVPIVSEGVGVSNAELSAMVNRSMKEVAQKKAKVYHSDVDKPNYHDPLHPDDFAIVVGIQNYQQISRAEFARRDAKAVRNHLLALGFPRRNLVYLPDSLATKSNLEKYLEDWLPARMTPSSNVVFYFSGHGAPDARSHQALLVPWDGDTGYLQKTGFPTKRLYADLNRLPAKRIVVMLDSCFSGAGGRSVLPQGARPLVTKIADGLGGARKLVVLSASSSDEISLSDAGQGHGLFTYYLLKGLNATHGDATVKALYDYLVPLVEDGARDQNQDQAPQLRDPDRALANLPLAY